ncbi:hypothetical protein EH220_01080 [bacterium]|nr:MAG: hypothetical protein EH220_01080 [bacterium]
MLQILLFITLVWRLGFLLIGTLIDFDDFRGLESARPLSDTCLKIRNAVEREEDLRVSSLYAYSLPHDGKDYGVWADSIQKHLGRSVAVFVNHDGMTEWLIEYQHLLPGKAVAESLAVGLKPDLKYTERTGDWKSTATTFRRLPDHSPFKVICFEQQGRSERWGVILSNLDSWRAFAEALNTFKHDRVSDNRVDWVVADLNISADEDYKYNFKIFIHDTLAFESPMFDSDKYVMNFDYDAVDLEIQMCKSEQQWRDLAVEANWGISWGWFDWISVIKWLACSFVLALFYRWILKLTKPEISP